MLDDKIESCRKNIADWEQEMKKAESETIKNLWNRFGVLISLFMLLIALWTL